MKIMIGEQLKMFYEEHRNVLFKQLKPHFYLNEVKKYGGEFFIENDLVRRCIVLH